jgi:hypothetical protein
MKQLISGLLLTATLSFAQQGTAPNGYYPQEFQGSTFAGEVVEGPLDVLTLKYTNGNHNEAFTGRFKQRCSVPTKDAGIGAMEEKDVPLGNTVEVLYYGTSKKLDGKTVKENWIIGISFRVVNGKTIPENKRLLYDCSGPGYRKFKAF